MVSPMQKLLSASLLAPTLVLLGCDGGGGSTDSELIPHPVEQGWETVVDAAFPQDGDAPVTEISIGSNNDSMDNFHNRGDVIVNYTGDAGKIVVEINRFTSAASAEEEENSFAKLLFWDYVRTISGDPENLAPAKLEAGGEANCHAGPWPDKCTIGVYYDGKTQDLRSGAHFRITLPKNYTGKLNVITQDNVRSEPYPARGDVKIKDLFGSAKVVVDSGNIDIKLAENISVAPTCPAADLSACEANGWDKDDCKCYPELGGVSAESSKANASNITVGVPTTLWATILASNDDSGSTLGCTAEVDCGAFGSCTEDKFPTDDKRVSLTMNEYEGENVIEGAGYNISIGSKLCQHVEYVDSPEQEGDIQGETRGDVKVCNGCANVD